LITYKIILPTTQAVGQQIHFINMEIVQPKLRFPEFN
jgi:hypothetical protein